MEQLYQILRDREGQSSTVLATVVSGAHTGEKLLLLDGQVRWHSGSWEFLQKQIARIAHIQNSQLLETEDGWIFFEKIGGRKTLVICGAGHVSIPVIEMGKRIGFYVVVIEDRPDFAEKAEQAGADLVICDSFEHALAEVSGNAGTYFVIVTRSHHFDKQCLKLAVQKQNAYVGMMGSRRKVAIVKEELQKEGIAKELLDKVYAPIGLDIGARTPEEIAVSVVAQIIQRKNTDKEASDYDEELLNALVGSARSDECCVLATLISKKGSGPRGIGAKMLVSKTGAVGTIGGGYVESRIIEECRFMINVAEESYKIVAVGMNKKGERADMICGGSVEVFLETYP